jgi:crossover junction endodeoxyribonuclease RuvC
MNILGIDASLSNMGYVVLKEGQILTSGTLRPKARAIERLVEVYDWLGTICKDYEIGLMAIEGYAYNPRIVAHSYELAELGGVIKLFFCQKNISYIVVAPTTLKLFATGSGKAQKSEMMLHVFKRWNVELNTEHEIDAYALAQMGHTIWQLRSNQPQQQILPEYQRRAINTILKGGNNYGGPTHT